LREDPPSREPRSVFYMMFAYVCIALGIIGALLPVMPTTPFLLLAAWAAPRGSPALHRWLYEHKTFGPVLEAWDENRAVSTTSKWLACIFMMGSWLLMLYQTETWIVPGISGVIFLSVGAYLVTRPVPLK